MKHMAKTLMSLSLLLLFSNFGFGIISAPDPEPSFNLSNSQNYWKANFSRTNSLEVEGEVDSLSSSGQEHIYTRYSGGAASLLMWNTSNTQPDSYKNLWVQIDFEVIWDNDDDPSNNPDFEAILQAATKPDVTTNFGENVNQDLTRITQQVRSSTLDTVTTSVKIGLGYTIIPNPPYEEIDFTPLFSDLNVGQSSPRPVWKVERIAAYSECVPEPTTLALLSFGGLLLRKRR